MNIILACNAGMSTSIMKMRLIKELKNRGLEGNVSAVPISELDDYLEDADILLLGPQVRSIEKGMKEVYPALTIVVISMKDYGSMDAAKVLDQVTEALK